MRIFSTLIIISISISQKSIAQNVGIGTSTPQKTLDVNGNFRSGGSNNFITHDSVSGKITWSNSYLFVPAPQYIIKHSASAEGLYSNGAQLEYRDQLGAPAFFTNWTNGYGYFSSKLGIGVLPTTVPLGFSQGLGDKISLYPNSSVNYGFGVQPSLLQIHTDLPAADIAFGYGSSTSFTENMRVKGNGNVGIGTVSPNAPLGFPPLLGKKITLYPGATGDVGFAVAGNRLQIYSDNPSADVAIGYDAAGTFNERFAFKPNGALAISGNTGAAGQVLTSNGIAAPAWNNNSKYFFFSQTGPAINLTSSFTNVPGIDGQTFTTTFTSNLIVTVSSFLGVDSGEPDQGFEIVTTAAGSQFNDYSFVQPGLSRFGGGNATSTIYIANVPAGTYVITCRGLRVSSSGNNSCNQTQLIVQVIPQ